MFDLARKYNSISYLVSGSHTHTVDATTSEAGKLLSEIILKRFQNDHQAKRFFDFYYTQNKVSETVGKAFQNFERVFSANDKKFEIVDLKNLKALVHIKSAIESFESNALPELKQNNTVFVAIVDKIYTFEVLFLPVNDKFGTEIDQETKEIIAYTYGNDIEIRRDFSRIGKEIFSNSTGILPVTKLIQKTVKIGVSWSPLYDYFGSLLQLILDSTAINFQKMTDSFPVTVTGSYKCTYSEGGNDCDNGKIFYYNESKERLSKPCPSCGLGIGVGVHLIVKGMVGESAPSLDSGYKKILGDLNGLKFNTEDFDKNKIDVYQAITGLRYTTDMEAGYQNRLKIVYDSQKAKDVFTILSKEFSRVERFITDFILRSMGLTNEVNINLGSDFYLLTIDDLILQLNEAKTAGLPSFVIQELMQKINELQFKDMSKVEEYKIWSILEPFAGRSLEEISNIATTEQKTLKANFISLVSELKMDLQASSLSEYINTTGIEFSTAISQFRELLNLKLKKYDTETRIDTEIV